MSLAWLILKAVGIALLFLVVAVLLAATIVPRFLDRIYYQGPPSDHFDGARFFNPDGDEDTLRPTPATSAQPRGRLGFFARYLLGNDGRPDWPDAVEVAPSTPPERVGGERMLVTWVGHATLLIQTQGLNILTDPVWSDRAGPLGFGPRRAAPPGVRFDDLPPIDLVLVSHNHYDHLDLATLRRVWARDRPRIVTSLGNDSIIRQAGATATALDWGGRVAVAPGVEVVATRAHHWGSRWFTDRKRALWSGFVIRMPGGNVFFSGDSGMGDGLWPAAAAALGPVRLALIPIGAFRFVEGQMGSGSHIGPVDAVEVHRRLGATMSLPIHWGTFRLSYEAWDTPPRLLEMAMECTGQTGFAAVKHGEPVEVPPYRAPAPVAEMPRDTLLTCLAANGAGALK